MDLLPAYRSLLTSPEALAACAAAGSFNGLLAQLRRLWALEGIGEGALVGELNRCNREVLDLAPAALEGRWLPTDYDARTRSIGWCLPRGHASDPFLQDFIDRCRHNVFNQLLRPRTALAPLLEDTRVTPAPAGFIFHLSRCGSTLVSGALAELDDTCVLSESPLLTAVLLDASLDDRQKQALLPRLVALQAAPFPGRGRIVVKWNAWDLCAWPLIRNAFPGVPRLLLFRDPVQILASQMQLVGRHMSGDPSLAGLDPAFDPVNAQGDLLDWQIRILGALMAKLPALADEPGAMPLDYAGLDLAAVQAVCRHFGLSPTADAGARLAQRLAFHSKSPGQLFQPDAGRKAQWFDAADRRRIEAALAESYQALRELAAGTP